ncbi:MAG: hypothetical protein J6W84_04375 [Bacteroidales bacterium]|nr:hypothetical protein [Bacteroidales bacterium]MBQ7489440.1 hypothetical protein [Bacteroidales bacterium]
MKRFLLFVFTVVLLSGCRYKEGPFLSFTSPDKRIVATWSLQNVYRNGEKITTSEYAALKPGCAYAFHAYGPLVVSAYVNGEIRESYTGTWQFANNKKEVIVKFFLVDRQYEYTAVIKKLSKTEFIYEYDDSKGEHWRLQMFSQAY